MRLKKLSSVEWSARLGSRPTGHGSAYWSSLVLSDIPRPFGSLVECRDVPRSIFTEYRVPRIKAFRVGLPSIYSYYYCTRRMG